MKMDRLIGILSILLQQERVTAPYLAEKFEVSRRTISRDIEDLCKAGIPLVTSQGAGGGISIMERSYTADLPGHAGDSGRASQSGQCQRNEAVCSADGKAFGRGFGADARGRAHPD